MPQHDYHIDNQPGAAFRSDLNAALSAIATLNSGSAAPSPTFPYQLWADTGAGILRMRNAGNTAWIAVLRLSDGLPTDPELLALAQLASAANRLPYFTGAGSAALTDLTAFARSLLDDPDAATARATLGAGSANGLATLGSDSRVPLAQLPTSLVTVVTYTTPGSYTFAPPTTERVFVVHVIGGGGGGGNGSPSARSAGGGGGGGGYAMGVFSSTQIGSGITVTVGAGGEGSSNGGSSSFGSLLSASGGQGASGMTGGLPGGGSGGLLAIAGSAGQNGGAGPTTHTYGGGLGGSSFLGGGGRGGTTGDGSNAGAGTGAGGGGGAGTSFATSGGLGGSGAVIIYCYT